MKKSGFSLPLTLLPLVALSACASPNPCQEPPAPFVLPEGVYEKYDDPVIVAREACVPKKRTILSLPSLDDDPPFVATESPTPTVTSTVPWQNRKTYKHEHHKSHDEQDEEEEEGHDNKHNEGYDDTKTSDDPDEDNSGNDDGKRSSLYDRFEWRTQSMGTSPDGADPAEN